MCKSTQAIAAEAAAETAAATTPEVKQDGFYSPPFKKTTKTPRAAETSPRDPRKFLEKKTQGRFGRSQAAGGPLGHSSWRASLLDPCGRTAAGGSPPELKFRQRAEALGSPGNALKKKFRADLGDPRQLEDP